MNVYFVFEAIRIYERLLMWPELIGCYRQLDKTAQAEAVIRQCLSENDNQPIMYCYLADITMLPEHYQKALQV